MLLQDGDTALILAAKRGHGEIVELFLKKRVDVNKKGLVSHNEDVQSSQYVSFGLLSFPQIMSVNRTLLRPNLKFAGSFLEALTGCVQLPHEDVASES